MTLFGVIITTIYILIIVVLRWSSFPELQIMPLNEFGDFFAGVFGPLMLFWLILGYIQQQKELRQNTKALELQADELRKSVEQHKELVAATREQVQAELKTLEIEQIRTLREAHPSFSVGFAGQRSKTGKIIKFEITILNSGQPASDVSISTIPSIKQVQPTNIAHYLATGETHRIWWDSKTSGEAPINLKLIINCKDANTQPYSKQFDLILGEHNRYHIVGTAEVS